jgi:hypothetical protein
MLPEALQQELIIPRSPSPEVVMGPLNPRSQSTVNVALSKKQRLANLKVCFHPFHEWHLF